MAAPHSVAHLEVSGCWTADAGSAILGAAVSSVCPRCARSRYQREGPYFVCSECRWRWTVSITGKVYVQSAWVQSPVRDERARLVRRLLASVDGLKDKLSAPWPDAQRTSLETAGFSVEDIERLGRARDAAEAAYFNEG